MGLGNLPLVLLPQAVGGAIKNTLLPPPNPPPPPSEHQVPLKPAFLTFFHPLSPVNEFPQAPPAKPWKSQAFADFPSLGHYRARTEPGLGLPGFTPALSGVVKDHSHQPIWGSSGYFSSCPLSLFPPEARNWLW